MINTVKVKNTCFRDQDQLFKKKTLANIILTV